METGGSALVTAAEDFRAAAAAGASVASESLAPVVAATMAPAAEEVALEVRLAEVVLRA